MTDPQLLILERGQGKTTALIKSILTYDGPWPDGAVHGVLLLADANRAHNFYGRAADFGGQANASHQRVILGDKRIKVTTARLLDSLRGHDRRTPVWVDDVQDFDDPVLELVASHAGLSKIVLATCTPWPAPGSPPRNDHPAPAAYNPSLIRHQLRRVDRPPVTDYPPTPLTGYLEGAPRG